MFQSLYKLRGFFKRYKTNQILAVFFLLISYFVTFSKPYLIGRISDSIVTGDFDENQFYTMLGLFGLIIFLTYFINVGWSFNLFKNIYLISRDTRNQLMAKYLKQFPKFFEKNSTGSLMGKATNDIEAMSGIVGYGVMCIFDAIIYPVVLLTVMAFISWQLTLFTLIALPPFIYILYKTNFKMEEKFRKLQESFDKMNDITLESISSIKAVRAFNVEHVFKDRFRNHILANRDADMEKNSIQQVYMPYSTVFNTILMSMSILGGVFLINQGQMTIGSLVTFTMYMGNLAWPAFALSDFLTMGSEGKTSIKRIEDILDYEEDIKDIENPVILKDINNFSLKNLYFKYPTSDREILKDINLDFKKGETVIIVGKTGSGKSTLLKQFMRLYDIDSGELEINNIPIENYERYSLIEKIAYVPQENYLFSRSIRDNIKLFRDFSDVEIEKAAILSDFKKDLDNFPKGLDTMTGEKGVALSGGQRQRIALSRALIKESEILILDDVFSAVDTKTEENIINNLEVERKGKTNIFTTHRLSVIKPEDHIVVLEDGHIEAQGNHMEVYNSSKWYKEQFDIQFMEVSHE